jgi:hypothetical protein
MQTVLTTVISDFIPMRLLRFSIALTITTSFVALAGCASAPAPTVASAQPRPVPAYLTTDRSCAIVLGGLVPDFADADVAGFWWKVSDALAVHTHSLLSKKYRTFLYAVPLNGQTSYEQWPSLVISDTFDRCMMLSEVCDGSEEKVHSGVQA